MGAACTRPSLRPLFSEGRDCRKTRVRQRRENVETRRKGTTSLRANGSARSAARW